MGRFVKNPHIDGDGVVFPLGPTAARPSSPVDGQVRYNNTTGEVEVYDAATWKNIAFQGNVNIVLDSFVGDGSTTVFTMSQSVTNDEEQRVIIIVGNVPQNPITAFVVSGTTLTFTSPPPNLEDISVTHGFDSTTNS